MIPFLFATVLAGAAPGELAAPRELPLPLRQGIMRFLNARMLDGPASRYKWPAQRKSKLLYCGWINGKNTMGGYVGWRPFYVYFSLDGTVERVQVYDPSDKADPIMFDALCKSNGYNIDTPPL